MYQQKIETAQAKRIKNSQEIHYFSHFCPNLFHLRILFTLILAAHNKPIQKHLLFEPLDVILLDQICCLLLQLVFPALTHVVNCGPTGEDVIYGVQNILMYLLVILLVRNVTVIVNKTKNLIKYQ